MGASGRATVIQLEARLDLDERYEFVEASGRKARPIHFHMESIRSGSVKEKNQNPRSGQESGRVFGLYGVHGYEGNNASLNVAILYNEVAAGNRACFYGDSLG